MDEEEMDDQEVLETPEGDDEEGEQDEDEAEIVLDTDPDEDEEEDDEEGDGEKTDREKALEKKNAKLFERAKKAEGFEKVDGKWVKKTAPKTDKKEAKLKPLSDVDIFALVKADVDEEDIDEVKKFASYQGISISAAIKNKTLKSILAERSEERATALAANAGGPRRSSKQSGDSLIAAARSGKLPQSDADIERLVDAEFAARQNRTSRA